MYFYWKICYFGVFKHFVYTVPGPVGGAKTLVGGPGPPGPTLATALVGFKTQNPPIVATGTLLSTESNLAM